VLASSSRQATIKTYDSRWHGVLRQNVSEKIKTLMRPATPVVTNESHPRKTFKRSKSSKTWLTISPRRIRSLKDVIAIGAWDATDIEKDDIQADCKAELRERIATLERENNSLRSPAVTCT
jgi:hypothetical protein